VVTLFFDGQTTGIGCVVSWVLSSQLACVPSQALSVPGPLFARVASWGGAVATFADTQIATIRGRPTIASNTAKFSINATSVNILGTFFSEYSPSDNNVTLTQDTLSNTRCAISWSNATLLVCTLVGDLKVGLLYASIAVDGIQMSTGPIQIADVDYCMSWFLFTSFSSLPLAV